MIEMKIVFVDKLPERSKELPNVNRYNPVTVILKTKEEIQDELNNNNLNTVRRVEPKQLESKNPD